MSAGSYTDFTDMITRLAVEYPHQCHIDAYKHDYVDRLDWLVEQEIVEYQHYTYRNIEPRSAMCFKYEKDAVLYALVWS